MKTFSKVAVPTVAAGLFLSGCIHPLQMKPGQEQTISPQAAAFIRKARLFSLPPFVHIGEKQIIAGREQFNASETKMQEALIAKYNLRVDRTVISDVPVLIISPAKVRPGLENVIAFNIFGGGFVMGDARDRSSLMMAGEFGIPVYSVEYSVSPEVKYPVALNQCLAVYRTLVTERDPRRIIGISSSAGGNLMLATLLKAKEQRLPMIKAQVLFAPSTDLGKSGDSGVANDGRDVIDAATTLHMVRDFYVGNASLTDPFVSPIYGQYSSDFPASVIVTGTRDLLLSNSIRLFWKLKDAGVATELLVGEGMWHGYHWEYEMPESIATMKSVMAFLDKQLK